MTSAPDAGILNTDPFRIFVCEHCGTKVYNYNPKFGFCYFCDQYVDKGESEVKKDPDLYSILTSISDAMSNGKWNDAAKNFDRIVAFENSAENVYANAVFYKAFSDYMYRQRDYITLGGYREQNADNINSGISLFHKSKALLYQAISMANSKLKLLEDENARFVRFLAKMKLNRLFDAKKDMQFLKEANEIRGAYANMIYYVATKNNLAADYAKGLAAHGLPNAYYYYALFLTEKDRNIEAGNLLMKLTGRIDFPAAKGLLEAIEKAVEII